LLVYITGIAVYIGGAPVARLGDNAVFYFVLTTTLLWLTILANIHGLGVGKWVNNIGGAGALVIGVTLIALAVILATGHASHLNWRAAAQSSTGALPLSTVGVVCLGLVGMELGPVMSDEIHDARRTIQRAVVLGGTLSAAIYAGTTLALLVGVPQSQMAVVQGMMQALDKMSVGVGVAWILFPLAILMIASILGSTSAWTSGSARILFVCGLDRYLPKSLGKIHRKYGSPYVALIMFGLLASSIIAMSFIGASVKEAYLTLLDLSVALQMISYLYLFLALMRTAFSADTKRICFSVPLLRAAAISGVAMTGFGLVMSFVPSRQISSVWSFELKMFFTLAFFLGIAGLLFSYYSRVKPQTELFERTI
jgi:amino acid transporter